MKNNPKWMEYWDNVNVGLYALIKQVKKKDNEQKRKNTKIFKVHKN